MKEKSTMTERAAKEMTNLQPLQSWSCELEQTANGALKGGCPSTEERPPNYEGWADVFHRYVFYDAFSIELFVTISRCMNDRCRLNLRVSANDSFPHQRCPTFRSFPEIFWN